MSFKKIALLPWYVLSLGTTAKNFRDNPVLGSPVLNALGLHVVRLVLAHCVFTFKQALLTAFADKQDRKNFRRDGFVIKQNYLPAEDFAALRAQAQSYKGEAFQCVQGDTITWRAMIDDELGHRYPAIGKLANDRGFLGLLKYTSGNNEKPMLYIQQIQNGYADSMGPDPQKVLHADTFQPTMKAWLFLEDVGPENGPFTYVAGSNRLSWKRILWEYKRSRCARDVHDGYSEKGSFRVEESDLRSLGLPGPQKLAVPANTLVIADTCGFHRRGDTSDTRATRLEIWAMSRGNPFNPYPGLDVLPFARWRDTFYRNYLRRTDTKARARGQRASWHAAPQSPKD